MGITIERITPATGAIVSGVDLAQPVDPQTRSAITDAGVYCISPHARHSPAHMNAG